MASPTSGIRSTAAETNTIAVITAPTLERPLAELDRPLDHAGAVGHDVRERPPEPQLAGRGRGSDPRWSPPGSRASARSARWPPRRTSAAAGPRRRRHPTSATRTSTPGRRGRRARPATRSGSTCIQTGSRVSWSRSWPSAPIPTCDQSIATVVPSSAAIRLVGHRSQWIDGRVAPPPRCPAAAPGPPTPRWRAVAAPPAGRAARLPSRRRHRPGRRSGDRARRPSPRSHLRASQAWLGSSLRPVAYAAWVVARSKAAAS